MYLKQLNLFNFRSYTEETVDLSPSFNAFVGHNGSGKSNLIAAIQLVLNPEPLTQAERRALLHTGAHRTVYHVSVELVFDNTDQRLTLPGDSSSPALVSIRRTVSEHHDEFRLNTRKLALSELSQLLEVAGISSANPYYVVNQGQVARMANQTSEERLALLQEIAGTRVYEERRAQSRELLQSSLEKRKEIEQSLQRFKKRLESLQEETRELTQARELTGKRKKMEAALLWHQVTSLTAQLEALGPETEEGSQRTAAERSEQVEEAREELERLTRLIPQLEANVRDARERHALAIQDASVQKTEGSGQEAKRSRNATQMLMQESEQLRGKHMETTIAIREETRKVQETLLRVGELSEQHTESVAILQSLQARQGGATSNQRSQEEKTAVIARLKTLEEEAQRFQNELDELQHEDAKDKVTTEKNDELEHATTERSRVLAARRGAWTALHEAEQRERQTRDASARATAAFERRMRPEVRQGLRSLSELDGQSTPPVLVAQLLQVPAELAVAAEAVSGPSLFHCVVPDASSAESILEEFNRKRKPGRITLLPLDSLRDPPDFFAESNLVRSLVQCSSALNPSESRRLLFHVFGNTLLAETLEEAASMSKDGRDAVTRDGDRFSRKGTVTGGHTRRGGERLNAAQTAHAAQVAKQHAIEHSAGQRQTLAEVEQQLARATVAVEAARAHGATAAEAAHATRVRSRQRADRRLQLQTLSTRNSEERSVQSRIIAALERSIPSSQATQPLSSAEFSRLNELSQSVPLLARSLSVAEASLATERAHLALLSDTAQHLLTRLRLVEDSLTTSLPVQAQSDAEGSSDVFLRAREVESTEAELERSLQHQRELTEEIQQHEQQQEHSLHSAEVSGNSWQRPLLLQRLREAQGKLRRLAVDDIPTNKEPSVLLEELRTVRAQLRGFSTASGGVNWKAHEEHARLTDLCKEFTEREHALEGEAQSLQKLMNELDSQTQTAVERTFKQIGLHFTTLVQQLAPGFTEQPEMTLLQNNRGDCVGVELRIGQQTSAEALQLSGGQRAILALAFLFAIHQTDPAPFYFLDEVDAALDPEHRTTLAELLKAESSHAQFLVISFKPELVHVSDSVFGITHQNKTSCVSVISKEEAEAALQHDE